jgi:osmoprotectant transport system permease protein
MSVFDLPSYVQSTFLGLLATQLEVALGATALGLAFALPIGQACARWRWSYPPVLGIVTVLYSIPSISLFIFLLAYTGLTETAVFIPLTLYSLTILVPGVVDGVRAVPPEVRLSAQAMGLGPVRRYLTVELPIATPGIMAAIRVATVSSISLMSIGAVLGNIGAFGDLIFEGLSFSNHRLIWLGVVSLAVLGVLCDLALRGVQRILTPWVDRRRTA